MTAKQKNLNKLIHLINERDKKALANMWHIYLLREPNTK